MSNQTDKFSSPEQFAAVQEQLELLFPALEESAASSVELSPQMLSEDSCLGPQGGEPQTQTSWLGVLRGLPADDAAANAAIDALASHLQSDNWTVVVDSETPDVKIGKARLVYLQQGPVNLRLTHERGYPDIVEVLATTPCMDHPQDHKMQRSPLDPSYGKSSRYYPDGA